MADDGFTSEGREREGIIFPIQQRRYERSQVFVRECEGIEGEDNFALTGAGSSDYRVFGQP